MPQRWHSSAGMSLRRMEFDGFEIYVSASYFNEDDQALYVELTALW